MQIEENKLEKEYAVVTEIQTVQDVYHFSSV